MYIPFFYLCSNFPLVRSFHRKFPYGARAPKHVVVSNTNTNHRKLLFFGLISCGFSFPALYFLHFFLKENHVNMILSSYGLI